MYVEILVVDEESDEVLPCRLVFKGREVAEIECDGRWRGEFVDEEMEVEISRPGGWKRRILPLPPFVETRYEIRLERCGELQ